MSNGKAGFSKALGFGAGTHSHTEAGAPSVPSILHQCSYRISLSPSLQSRGAPHECSLGVFHLTFLEFCFGAACLRPAPGGFGYSDATCSIWTYSHSVTCLPRRPSSRRHNHRGNGRVLLTNVGAPGRTGPFEKHTTCG